MMRFSIPYLIACFLQTFYGLADLFITGQYNGAAVVAAVSIGSQVLHMLTVIIIGLAMGTTVSIGYAIGAKDRKQAGNYIGNTVSVFVIFAVAATIGLLLSVNGIMTLLQVPAESTASARQYLVICFIGVPFITAYNVISSIFRGLGDTKRPMIFVAIAGVVNIGLDWLFIGPLGLGAAGAAVATVTAQALSSLMAYISLRNYDSGIHVAKKSFKLDKRISGRILGVGAPIALQDGLIQVSFLIITAIANSRGVDIAAAVGIVEKLISFFFLVPSAMLSTVSAVTAQNAGAKQHDRGRQALRYGILFCTAFGTVIFTLCQFFSPGLVGLFVNGEPDVVRYGAQYLRAYSLDCVLASIHFCFSGYFNAYGKSLYSFAHNVISIVTFRIPGVYFASVMFPSNLYPMGLAAPLGSLLSDIICVFLYRGLKKQIEAGEVF